MGRHSSLRENPIKLLENCRTIVTLAYPYPSEKPATPDGFTAARYTEPNKNDYHSRSKRLAQMLSRRIKEQYPGSKTRVCVDSAPILERSFAYASGVGFIGKNNMLIIPGYGSYFFLVEILTTAFWSYSEIEPMENKCGTCTRCVDACPTGALETPFCLDVSRCLSYLTIEYPGVVSSETGGKMGNCFLGCDICQEVCPYNEGALTQSAVLPPTDKILAMGPEKFRKTFGKTAFARPGLDKLKDNIRAVRTWGHSNRQRHSL